MGYKGSTPYVQRQMDTMLRPLRTFARAPAEDLPSSEIGTNGGSSLSSCRLMTTVTDETFEVTNFQLVTKLNNEIRSI